MTVIVISVENSKAKDLRASQPVYYADPTLNPIRQAIYQLPRLSREVCLSIQIPRSQAESDIRGFPTYRQDWFPTWKGRMQIQECGMINGKKDHCTIGAAPLGIEPNSTD